MDNAGTVARGSSRFPSLRPVPVAAHNPGLNQSQWRSDLGLLNPGAVAANVQLEFFGAGGTVSNTTYVPAAGQSILSDVVGQLGASGQGALEVLADLPLKITTRTYSQVADAGCYSSGRRGMSPRCWPWATV
jgi:hypothetical protein